MAMAVAIVNRNVALLARYSSVHSTRTIRTSAEMNATDLPDKVDLKTSLEVRSSDSLITDYKRGKGGRSSFSGMVCTVFGAKGTLGRILVNRLGKIGSQIIVPYRGDPYGVRDLKLCGDLGQVLFVPFSLRDEESIRKSLRYSNTVINVIGRDYETPNFSFEDVHVTGPARIARIAREMGIKHFVHVSALNASLNPSPCFLPRGSEFLRSKRRGEDAVRSEMPSAVIFRPSDMFGQRDRFLSYYAHYKRRSLLGNAVTLWKRGQQTIKQPVFYPNVADGIMNALSNYTDATGKTYECVGPNRYYLKDLVEYMYRVMRWDPQITITPSTPLLRLKLLFFETTSRANKFMSHERFERDCITDALTGAPTLEDLGVRLTRLEDRIQFELKMHRYRSYYNEMIGEFPDADPPPTVPLTDLAKHQPV